MLRKLFSHTAIYGLAPHVSKLASFFVLPIITQYLTPLDYGIYGVLTATVGSISVFSSLGLRVVLVNSFFKSPGQYKWLWRQIYGFLSIWVIPYAIISSILVYFIVPSEAHEHIWTIIGLNVAPIVLFGQTNTLASTYYQVNKKPLPIAIRTAVFSTLTVLLNLYLIAILKLGYMGWLWSTFIVGILQNASYWIPLNLKFKIYPIYRFKWRTIRNSLRVSLPTVPHFYSSYLLNASDRLIMGVLNLSTGDIGKYNAAYTFGNYFSNLGNASGFAVGPLLNECYRSREDEKARNLIFVQQTAFLVMSFTCCIWLKELFQFFIRNDQLNKMYYLAVIIVMAYNYRPMYFGANAKLLYLERTRAILRVSFGAGLINVLLNLALIPLMGFEVAAYTTFFSLMYMGYAGYFMKAFRESTQTNYYPLFWLGLTILLTVVAYYVVHFDWHVKAILTCCLVPGIAYLYFRLKHKVQDTRNEFR
jgi:Membrane protein involved in the export of O-antigen and teichoic acid